MTPIHEQRRQALIKTYEDWLWQPTRTMGPAEYAGYLLKFWPDPLQACDPGSPAVRALLEAASGPPSPAEPPPGPPEPTD